MTHKTFTLAGIKVRTQSNCRFVAWQVSREYDGVRYADVKTVTIWKRSNNLGTLQKLIQRQGFHSSRYFLITDADTGHVVDGAAR